MYYGRQLQRRWGLRVPLQILRMIKLHRTSFKTILMNIFSALEYAHGKFTFPIVGAIAKMRPYLVHEIVKEGHEVASHGYNHMRYPTLSEKEREKDLYRSIKVFKNLGITVHGFRAPYDNYTDDMPLLVNKYNLLWDGGFGYRPEHREKTHFFQIFDESKPLGTTFIPLNILSDDKMIGQWGMKPESVTKLLKREIMHTSKHKGVVMFDLHPIRMGQKNYVECLREITEYANNLGGWCPTATEAVTYWNTHNKWKGDASFCLLLTGDIDNWVFADYLRRIIWKQLM